MFNFGRLIEQKSSRTETYVKTISNTQTSLLDDEMEFLIADGYELIGGIRTVTEWAVDFSDNEKRFDVIHYATFKKVIHG